MYGLFGINHNIENIYKLSALYNDGSEIVTIQDLKHSYLKFLKSVHTEFPISIESEMIIQDQHRAKIFSSAFAASRINDLNQEKMVGELQPAAQLALNTNLIQKSLSSLKKQNSELAELFELAVHSIVLCGSNENTEGFRAHGGTTSKCIGLIWLSLRPDVSEQNIIEMLIHELTHTLVFLDELNNEHFNYENLTKSEFWATSSILKRRRPMDKVVHSILVSLEILYARQTYLTDNDDSNLFHPSSVALVSSIKASIDSVLTHPRLREVCKPRAIELVQIAQSQLESNHGKIYG